MKVRVAVAVPVAQLPPAGPYLTTALMAEMSVPKLTPTEVAVRSVRYGYRFSFASKAAGATDGMPNTNTAAIAAVNPQNPPRVQRCLKASPCLRGSLRSSTRRCPSVAVPATGRILGDQRHQRQPHREPIEEALTRVLEP
jgi:hypothetical protein